MAGGIFIEQRAVEENLSLADEGIIGNKGDFAQAAAVFILKNLVERRFALSGAIFYNEAISEYKPEILDQHPLVVERQRGDDLAIYLFPMGRSEDFLCWHIGFKFNAAHRLFTAARPDGTGDQANFQVCPERIFQVQAGDARGI